MVHIPVLQKEVLEYLSPKPNENFIDGTIGQGGHAKMILEKTGPLGKILGIDQDEEQIENCKKELSDFKGRLILVNDSYVNLKEIVGKNNFQPINGILLDLGMSSWHLEESGRGFAFSKDEPLDMRYRRQDGLTAQDIVNKWPEKEIERILKEYGQERFFRKIAKEIIEERKKQPIKTTSQLVAIIQKAIPRRFFRGKIHYATKTFQALRIAVNDELNNLKNVLSQIIEILEPGGRAVIISFHSLEDRIVKNFFKDNKDLTKILIKKPIMASLREIKENPRARSAKLRTIIKI